jgi:hypothetical protein
MQSASKRTLNILAAIVWYAGGIVLLLKGSRLLIEANFLEPEKNWHWVAAAVGILAGGIKAKYLFNRACKKNLDRIAALKRPKIWQFFRPGFFIFLGLMILVGAMLSRMAHNNYLLLIAVALLDLGIGSALVTSSYVFWTQKAFKGNGG